MTTGYKVETYKVKTELKRKIRLKLINSKA